MQYTDLNITLTLQPGHLASRGRGGGAGGGHSEEHEGAVILPPDPLLLPLLLPPGLLPPGARPLLLPGHLGRHRGHHRAAPAGYTGHCELVPIPSRMVNVSATQTSDFGYFLKLN